jgi:DNA sulfur modification protein DndE
MISVKTSEQNKEIVQKLTSKFGVKMDESIVARLAITYSLSRRRKLDVNLVKDSKGKEYKESTLFGTKSKFYIALICQNYQIYKTSGDITKYIKLHLDDGLELLNNFFENNTAYSIYDFLIEHVDKGLEFFENAQSISNPVANRSQQMKDKQSYSKLLKAIVGKRIDNNEQIEVEFNNLEKYNSCHVAVAGGTGTGKTQFALSLIKQIIGQSKGTINYLYLDFKGLGKEKVGDYQPFFKSTNTNFIDDHYTPFPLNPLSFIDPINETNRILGINKFVDILAKYAQGIGGTQIQTLRQATKEVFEEKLASFRMLEGTGVGLDSSIPDLIDIYEKVMEMEGGKAVAYTKVLQDLCYPKVFDKAPANKKNFLEDNYYLSLTGDLPDSVRFTAVFLVINYIYNTFMNLSDSDVKDNVRSIRYMLVIDEAHTLFKQKKSHEILEKILREIRSRGVMVLLLSQGIEEYIQADFDFSSMCEIAFLLDIKDKNNPKLINKFMGFPDSETKMVSKSMEKIVKGQAISNIKEYKKGELLEIRQFHKD